MWIGDFVYALPLWAGILVAFAPAALIAIIMHPLSYLLDAGRRTERLRASLSALVGTAFVFLVSLSTNTLWGDASGLSGAIGDLAVQERDLYLNLKANAPDKADEFLELVATHNQLILDRELYDGAIAGNREIDQVLVEITDLVDGLPADSPGLDRIKTDFQDFLVSRDEYLSALNFPGLPDVVWFCVITLGMLYVALLALQRSGKSRKFAGVAIVGVVFAIGLIQLPMWSISSFWLIRTISVDSLTSAARPDGGPGAVITGQFGAAVVVAGVMVLLVMLALGWERRNALIEQEERADDQEDDEQYAQQELRDVLIEIRDELRAVKISGAEQLVSDRDQDPTDAK